MTVRLAAVEYGAGPPVAILHGLFGSARNWTSIARRLAARHRVIAFDLRNHGSSPWAPAMDYCEMAADVLSSLDALGCRRAALIGHSMGGKAAMIAALADPETVDRLVVVDIAPVPYPVHHQGLVRAMRALELSQIGRRADADRLLAESVPDAGERGFLLQNLVFEAAPEPHWRINLEAIDRAMPALAEFPAPPVAVYEGPTLFIAGARSDYVLPEYEPEIRRLFPRARVVRIADAGHWVHAEQPREFLEIVEPFLDSAQ
jgi:pimeloyl-ACP methyl ester carboxylesterase